MAIVMLVTFSIIDAHVFAFLIKNEEVLLS